MLKSEIIAALEKIHGDPEIAIKLIRNDDYTYRPKMKPAEIDRINEYPRPEIVVIEK